MLEKKKTYPGFSLIELLVVVAILGIIASVAIPSYNRYIMKSRRSEAMINLVKLQGLYEEFNTQNSVYPVSNTSPPAVTPPIASTTYYSYTSATTSTTYTMTATALAGSSQTADAEGGVACSTLTVDNLGNQTPNACWRQ